MAKQKKVLFIVIGILAIAVTVIVFCIAQMKNTPQQKFLKSLDEALTLYGKDAAKITEDEQTAVILEKQILSHVDYKVITEDEESISLRISAPDMRLLIENDGDNLLWHENGLAELLSRIEQGGFTAKEIELTVILNDDGTAVNQEELTDALYGGLFTVLSETIENIAGGN